MDKSLKGVVFCLYLWVHMCVYSCISSMRTESTHKDEKVHSLCIYRTLVVCLQRFLCITLEVP